jgi:AAA domain-containing protein
MTTQDSEFTYNPYLKRTPVRDSSKFINRNSELLEIYTYLNSAQSVWIIGERGSGKSSLLYQLTAAQGSIPNKCYFLDMQRVLTSTEFYYEGLKEFQRHYKSTDSQDSRKDFLETITSGEGVILCLDNFDTAIGNINFDEGFFRTLTSLVESSKLTLVVTSEFTPIELFESAEVPSSSFYNLFSTLYLNELSDIEALEFIKQPASNVGKPFRIFEEREILSFLQKNSKLYPHHINVACAIAFEGKLRDYFVHEDSLQEQFIRKLDILQEEPTVEAVTVVEDHASRVEALLKLRDKSTPLIIRLKALRILRQHQVPLFTAQERIPLTASLVILGIAILFISSKSENITGVYIAILLLSIALLLQIYFIIRNLRPDKSSTEG